MIRGFKIDFGQTSLETRGCYAVLFSRAAPVAQSLPCPDAESELTKQIMKKIFSVSVLIGILAAVSVSSFAQGRSCQRGYDSRSYNSRGYNDSSRDYYYDNSRGYSDNSRAYYDYGYSNRTVWDRHRDKLTVGGGTLGGAIIGGLIGGRRGAAIGALAGAGGSALYTYKLRNRRYRY